MVLCLANFLVLLDTTIVSVAVPDIQRGLDAGIDEALWVLNGYLLAFASLLIVFGRLGDLAGPRNVFIAGLGLFTIASVLCGLAPAAGALVTARVLQGIGAAAMLPQALVLITASFPPARRGAAFGIFTAVAGVASVGGLTLGGLLVTALGWQSIFFINLPVGLAGLLLAARLVPDLRPGRRHRFDLVGVLLATGGLVGITFGLVEGQRHGWGPVAGPVTVPGIMLAAAVLFALFVLWERRAPEPLLDLGLLRVRNYALAMLITMLTSFSLFGLLLVLVLQTQAGLGMSPMMSGVTALPWVLTLSAMAPVAGRLADRIGGRALLVGGLAVYGLGVLGVTFVATTESTAATYLLPLTAVGIGTGMTLAPATTEAMRPIAPWQVGAASGLLNTARQVGAALGAAGTGAVLQNRLAGELDREVMARLTALPDDTRAPFMAAFEQASVDGLQLGIGQRGGLAPPADLPPDAAAQLTDLANEAFSSALFAASRPTLMVVAAAILLGSLLSVFMMRGGPRVPAAASPLAGPLAGHQHTP
jgi:EmrB/QacA subfamily drug resistance transporter